jgi:hypothetical protein
VQYNFQAGVTATWKEEKEQPPTNELVDTARVRLLIKAINRTSGT